ncbi:hypothetical protein J4434_08435 [Candidatus Woesearchaeota archaeon]|nr:hypothetical protein [Candidatus Woesearchaeota archaeon]
MIEDFIVQPQKMVLYCFSTEHLQKKDKVRFYYALKGRDGKTGIVKLAKIQHIGKGVLLVPYMYDEDVTQFFRVWNLNYKRQKVIVDEETDMVRKP